MTEPEPATPRVNRMRGTKTLIGQIPVDVVRDTGVYLREHVGEGSIGKDKFQLSRGVTGLTIFIERFRGHSYTLHLDVELALALILEKTEKARLENDDDKI